MSDGGGYIYANEGNDSDRRDVLKNKLDIRSNHYLNEAEYRSTSAKRIEIELGRGPAGNFDAAHRNPGRRARQPPGLPGGSITEPTSGPEPIMESV